MISSAGPPGAPGLGHTEAVSCLELLPACASAEGPGEVLVASGGADGDLKLWKTNGELMHAVSHGIFITAMKFFPDGGMFFYACYI